LFALNGKTNLLGIYNELSINMRPQVVPQLVFFFQVEGDLSETPVHPLIARVTLPTGQSAEFVNQMILPATRPGRTKWFSRMPVILTPALLDVGQIKAEVIHGSDVLPVTGPWITEATPVPSSAPAQPPSQSPTSTPVTGKKP
jgi:hypothetical protein